MESRARRVVVLRRRLREELAVTESDAATGQQVFSGMAELWRGQEIYEYAVLVTSLSEECWEWRSCIGIGRRRKTPWMS
jgi:hypothetical protein